MFLFRLTHLYLLLSTFAAGVVVSAEKAACSPDLPADFSGDDWPTVYRLENPDPSDPVEPNFDESTTVDPSVLARAGVTYRYIDPTGFDYPNATAEVPWEPPEDGNNDPIVAELRADNDYQYADIIVVTSFIPKFWDEHLHEATTIRCMLDGSGYFDLRDTNDEWVRIPVSAGDWFSWPSGIYHRFSVDEDAYIQAMRLYKGSSSPEWTAVSRSEVAGNNTSRNAYVDSYLCGDDPDAPVEITTIDEVENDVDGNYTGSLWGDDKCSIHSKCAAIGLVGACCPTTSGVVLECCDTYVAPSSSPRTAFHGAISLVLGVAAAVLAAALM